LKIIEQIPRIWKRAYVYICIWYAINFAVSSFFEWKFVNPAPYILWSGLFMFEALCVFIILIFLYSHWLTRFGTSVQVAGHVAGLLMFFLINGTLNYYFTDYLDGLIYFDNWKEYMLELMSWDALRFYDQYIITVGIYYGIRYFQGLQREEQAKSDLAIKNREMQISLLKSQINPHFLFNTLNSISTLVHSSKEQARKVITQLSDVFRYALDSHSGDMVKLIHEINFIETYIKIQQVRFGDRLIFTKDVDPSCLNIDIPPMILQPLVENSVKYGIAPKEEGGTISLTVRRSGNVIFFEVKDDGLGTNAKKVMDGSSSGVGMINTDKRLKSYFGTQSGLRVKATELGYAVSFYIQLKETKTDPPRMEALVEERKTA
jgi:two-component system, LytTR family, sensor kinase